MFLSAVLFVVGAGAGFAQSEEKVPAEANQVPSPADLMEKAPPEASASSPGDLDVKAGANPAPAPPAQAAPASVGEGGTEAPGTTPRSSERLARTGSEAIVLLALGTLLLVLGCLLLHCTDLRGSADGHWWEFERLAA
ncbi:MAG: hypothetical protein M3179_09080 [Actinomycetota bacterium]|nr:hypothetical protein [Actinomycetota bacterium]